MTDESEFKIVCRRCGRELEDVRVKVGEETENTFFIVSMWPPKPIYEKRKRCPNHPCRFIKYWQHELALRRDGYYRRRRRRQLSAFMSASRAVVAQVHEWLQKRWSLRKEREKE